MNFINWFQKDVDWLLGDICNGDVIIFGGLLFSIITIEAIQFIRKKESVFF